jgi:L-ascorbate metabolism protein UlaG (beta-lactamase superfamily)
MKITYFAHACFGLEGEGLRVLLDPYEPMGFGGRMRYTPIPGTWDVVVISHDHADHAHLVPSFGTPQVLRGPGTALGLELRTRTAPHGDAAGTMEATTRVGRLVLDDLAMVHPGDLAGPLDDDAAAALGPVDVLFVPVGGHFTAGPAEALALIRQLTPRVAIPMHYKTPHADLPIGSLDDFLGEVSVPIRRVDSGTLELTPAALPDRTEVWTLLPTACPAQ